MESDVKQITEKVKRESDFANTLMFEMGKVIVGQKYLIERLLIGILSNGHVLLEGVPGLAKTLSITTLAKAMQAGFQ
ncbi:MAG: ATPase, partial [Planctomycetota bacterium]